MVIDEIEDLIDSDDEEVNSDETTLKDGDSLLRIDDEMLGNASDEYEDCYEDARDTQDELDTSGDQFSDVSEYASSKQYSISAKVIPKVQKSSTVNDKPLRIQDVGVLLKLKEADEKATQTVKIVEELKRRISEIQNKDCISNEDNLELQVINKELKDELLKLENITRKVQRLVGMADNKSLIESDTEEISPNKPTTCKSGSDPVSLIPTKYEFDEDYLPKVIICGPANDRIPSVIVCEYLKQIQRIPLQNLQETPVESKANQNLEIQVLESQVNARSSSHKCLQIKLNNLEDELKAVKNDNVTLVQKLNRLAYGLCPADVEYRLQMYKNNATVLEKQLSTMTTEMCWLQSELIKVHRDRDVLKDLLKSQDHSTPLVSYEVGKMELRNLKEQYKRLEEDYKRKVIEVSVLSNRCEELSTKFSSERDERGSDLKAIDGKYQYVFSPGCNGDAVNYEIQLKVTTTRLAECQDELEELKVLYAEQQVKVDEYRRKYLAAQQIVEQQRNQVENIRIDNSKITEQINIEVMRVKNSFNDKLKNLTPLPFILEETNIKLEQALTEKSKAESSLAAITKEFQLFKDKAQLLVRDVGKGRTLNFEDFQLVSSLELQKENACLMKENEQLRTAAEKTAENEKRLEKKLHEAKQLAQQLDDVRQESARQVSRAKERSEMARKTMEAQILELETNLTQSRAAATIAQKDRDEIKSRMQGQINFLNYNFKDARTRIKHLQMHVDYLKKAIPATADPNNNNIRKLSN